MASVEQLSKLGLVPRSLVEAELAPLAKGLPLRNRKGVTVAYAMVDPDVYEWASQVRWFRSAQGYVMRNVPKEGEKGQRTLPLARAIMGLDFGDPRKVDHKDHNPLSNVRSNLRICTHAENHQNRRAEGVPGSTSKYRGVSWSNYHQSWWAAVWLNGRQHFVGRFDDEDEAGRAAAKKRRELMPFTTN